MVIRANFKLFHLYFATVLVKKYHFLSHFLSWPPPPKKVKSKKKKKKKAFSFWAPLLRIPGHAPVQDVLFQTIFSVTLLSN